MRRHARTRMLHGPLLAALVVVAVLSIGGFLLARSIVANDQQAAATRRAAADRVRAEILLERAKSYLVGLAGLLASEPTPGQPRFAFLAGTTISSFDLIDALWVKRVGPVLLARYATTVTPGTDVSRWTALAAPIAQQGTVFAATATRRGSLHGVAGFWLVQSGRFGRGAGSSGYLAAFVPEGWITLSLQDDPHEVEVSLDGQHLEGHVAGSSVATANFVALGQTWRIRAAPPPPGTLADALPWLALGWPWVAGVVVALVGHAVIRRRRAEHEVERIFDFSLDLLSVANQEGSFLHVNPAFTRTLGYTAAELTSRPFMDFVVPEDRERTREEFARLLRGEEVVQFENRYRRRDGSVCWLEWSVHPVAREGLLYAAARDVTARREAEEKVRQTELTLRASRDQLRLLADEHAAIRRVATLVAHAVAPSELFSAVAREVRALLESDAALLLGCEDDDTLRIVAADAREDIAIAPGVRYPIAHDRLAARIRKRRLMTAEPQSAVSRGQPGAHLRDQGLQAAAAAPVIVDGALWGVVEVAWSRSHTVPASTAERLTHFAELVATAVANAHSRAELTASRARVVAAADEARRRIERDLHDGTQQRLVALSLALRLAEAQVPHEFVDLRERISAVAEGLAVAVTDLQEFSRGIHPAILSRGGLGPALRALARRSSIPVDLEANIGGRMDTAVEVAAYYLVSEALTNAAKHSGAARIEVHAHADGGELALTIRDDGVGGADLSHGSGLVGLLDRVQAVGGTLNIRSEHGRGTTLRAAFPLERHGDGDSAHRAAPAERLGA